MWPLGLIAEPTVQVGDARDGAIVPQVRECRRLIPAWVCGDLWMLEQPVEVGRDDLRVSRLISRQPSDDLMSPGRFSSGPVGGKLIRDDPTNPITVIGLLEDVEDPDRTMVGRSRGP